MGVRQDSRQESRKEFLRSIVNVVYEDNDIVVINKPAGLLTVATDKIRSKTAIHELNDYLNVGNRRKVKEVFVVHRLDRDASGLLVFARNQEIKHLLQDNWEKVEKRYYAVVEGKPKQDSGTISSYLRENKAMRVYSTEKAKEASDAKLSVTRYKILQSNGRYSLIEVILQTGRKHQIRVHLSDIRTPIIGDDRYGAKTNPAGRLGLHAYYLKLHHPRTGKQMVFETPLPDPLKSILR